MRFTNNSNRRIYTSDSSIPKTSVRNFNMTGMKNNRNRVMNKTYNIEKSNETTDVTDINNSEFENLSRQLDNNINKMQSYENSNKSETRQEKNKPTTRQTVSQSRSNMFKKITTRTRSCGCGH